ncbi:unnamed protein product [Amoebophrya sp. A120]|nr:unnamed protein product [Amoebophrya sp. A120]|eukprot:GSA120T00017460001.1
MVKKMKMSISLTILGRAAAHFPLLFLVPAASTSFLLSSRVASVINRPDPEGEIASRTGVELPKTRLPSTFCDEIFHGVWLENDMEPTKNTEKHRHARSARKFDHFIGKYWKDQKYKMLNGKVMENVITPLTDWNREKLHAEVPFSPGVEGYYLPKYQVQFMTGHFNPKFWVNVEENDCKLFLDAVSRLAEQNKVELVFLRRSEELVRVPERESRLFFVRGRGTSSFLQELQNQANTLLGEKDIWWNPTWAPHLQYYKPTMVGFLSIKVEDGGEKHAADSTTSKKSSSSSAAPASYLYHSSSKGAAAASVVEIVDVPSAGRGNGGAMASSSSCEAASSASSKATANLQMLFRGSNVVSGDSKKAQRPNPGAACGPRLVPPPHDERVASGSAPAQHLSQQRPEVDQYGIGTFSATCGAGAVRQPLTPGLVPNAGAVVASATCGARAGTVQPLTPGLEVPNFITSSSASALAAKGSEQEVFVPQVTLQIDWYPYQDGKINSHRYTNAEKQREVGTWSEEKKRYVRTAGVLHEQNDNAVRQKSGGEKPQLGRDHARFQWIRPLLRFRPRTEDVLEPIRIQETADSGRRSTTSGSSPPGPLPAARPGSCGTSPCWPPYYTSSLSCSPSSAVSSPFWSSEEQVARRELQQVLQQQRRTCEQVLQQVLQGAGPVAAVELQEELDVVPSTLLLSSTEVPPVLGEDGVEDASFSGSAESPGTTTTSESLFCGTRTGGEEGGRRGGFIDEQRLHHSARGGEEFDSRYTTTASYPALPPEGECFRAARLVRGTTEVEHVVDFVQKQHGEQFLPNHPATSSRLDIMPEAMATRSCHGGSAASSMDGTPPGLATRDHGEAEGCWFTKRGEKNYTGWASGVGSSSGDPCPADARLAVWLDQHSREQERNGFLRDGGSISRSPPAAPAESVMSAPDRARQTLRAHLDLCSRAGLQTWTSCIRLLRNLASVRALGRQQDQEQHQSLKNIMSQFLHGSHEAVAGDIDLLLRELLQHDDRFGQQSAGEDSSQPEPAGTAAAAPADDMLLSDGEAPALLSDDHSYHSSDASSEPESLASRTPPRQTSVPMPRFLQRDQMPSSMVVSL